ncbi:DUF29 domain-containing protein [Gloeothece verrucosa]|uniref:DUF29 domain-containing protein n=1 Tax=Gloeothece verrucosa (strain PCC 7822) TaxID=497965 RepID=E0U6N2_GLOV7|nr:DUF29 domain-containing protein [Gloeothece verrucosa]ADN14791.1 protein of unknown function DUF29 [Gloeothece verrucosa PCC 7822]
MNIKLAKPFLYETDYYLWLQTTLKQIQEKDINNLDWQHLIEEIETLGNEQKHKVASYLKQLLKHLLMYSYWESEKAYCANGWKEEIFNFRDELNLLLESKTLYNYAQTCFDSAYEKAKKLFLLKTGLPKNTIPEQCPFTFEQTLDIDYLPE